MKHFQRPSESFLTVLKRLHHWCPLNKSVHIYRMRFLDYNRGSFKAFFNYYRIRIHVSDPGAECEVLIHEWAHALTEKEPRPERGLLHPCGWCTTANAYQPLEVHSGSWGLAYAKCFRAAMTPITSKTHPDFYQRQFDTAAIDTVFARLGDSENETI